jgi:LysM repeat protein
MNRHSGVQLICIMVLAGVFASACTQVYSQAPLGTPTLIPTGLFVSPFPSGQDPLKIVADLGTQTAMAKTAQAGGLPTSVITGTPPTATTTAAGPSKTPTVGTPVTAAVTTPAPATVMPLTGTAISQVTVVAPTVAMTRPATYTLQLGEFPYCIARRFNLNPSDLLSTNNLGDGSLFYPGLTLTIPQTGSFPGDRSLHSHPDTYTVDSPGTTVYGVACYYGDVLPQNIAGANGLSLSSPLTVGQKLTIP